MNQLRLDPLTGRWVVVSTDRSHRPFSFAPPAAVQADTTRPCPFCPGNEESTAPALETYGSSGHWLVRVVPNLYPAFEGDHPFVVENRGPVFTQATAGGIHEVLVLSPEHDHGWEHISDEQAVLVMAAIRDRIEEHSSVPGLRYSQAIVNAGREAGASIEHPHGQLLGHVVRPPRARRGAGRLRPLRRALSVCAPPSTPKRTPGYRVVYADERILVVCPFWSGNPYEMLIIPRNHGPHLHRASPADLSAVGRSLRVVLGSLVERSATSPTTSSSTPPPTGRPSPTTGTCTCGRSSPPRRASRPAPVSSSTSCPPSRPPKNSACAVPA